jgi:hypothetical protein
LTTSILKYVENIRKKRQTYSDKPMVEFFFITSEGFKKFILKINGYPAHNNTDDIDKGFG